MACILNRGPFVRAAAAVAVILLAPRAYTQQASSKASVISVERSGGRVSYKVDSQRVGDLLLALNRIRSREGSSQPVAVLIDSTLPISEIWNVDGIAGKAQLTNVRFFIVFRESKMMSEIKRMPAVRAGTPID